LRASAQARLEASRVHFTRIEEGIALDMLYAGQTHTLNVALANEEMALGDIQAAFEKTYLESFGRVLKGLTVRVLNVRYHRIGIRPKFDLSLLAPQGGGSIEILGHQKVYHDGVWLEVPRYARLNLPVGAQVQGPGIFEQADATLWLEPGFVARVDALGNLLIEKNT